MIIPSHSYGVVASSGLKRVVAFDRVIDTISPPWIVDNFGEIKESGVSTWNYSTRRITGINTPIGLYISGMGSLVQSYLCYKIDTSAPLYSNSNSPATYGFTDFQDEIAISVSNGDYITFCARWVGSFGEEYGTLLIENMDDNNTLIGSVNYSSYSIFAPV